MIDIEDQLHTFDDAQLQHLRDRANAYGFDLKVTVADGSHSKAQLEQHVTERVTGRNQVSIGVDPKHHFTFVRGSRDLGLPNGPDVASAGNAFFKRGDLVGGIDAIAARANSLKATRVVESQSGVPIVVHEHTTSSGVWWMLGGLAALIIAVVVYLLWRSNKRDAEARRLAAELNNEIGDRQIARAERGDVDDFDARLRASSRPLTAAASTPAPAPSRRQPYSAYSYPAPAPSQPPVFVNNGGNRDGLMDVLLVDALLHDRHDRERVVEREVVVEREGSSSSWGSTPSDSDSNSSSSWDSGSDSSSSSDWGGGDSGGSDSSGGGSDW